MVGIDNLTKLVVFGCELINVGAKLLNGGSLWVLTSLIDDLGAVKTVKKENILAEIKDLSPEEKGQLFVLAKQTIKVGQDELDKKIKSGLDLVDEAIEVGIHGVAVIAEFKVISEKAKTLITSQTV